jgi:hypothetical protein
MIKKLCGMALWAVLLLGAPPSFAFQATLTGTAVANGCAYSLATVDASATATDGSVTITCGGTLPAATATATLKDVVPSTALSCNYKSVDFAENGALIVTCAKTPVCTPSATPAGEVKANTPVTLTANCTPTPTSYTWTNAAGCSGATCLVSPTVTTIYSVMGSNSDGSGSSAPVTVKVNSSATAVPVCTLTSYSSTFTPGDEVLLTANCTPAATSWVWTGGGCSGKNTPTCSDYPKVATTYTVIAKNDIGADSQRSVTVTPSGTTPTPTPTPAISCSLTASPSTSIAPGASVTLTASCTPGATSYVWTGGSCAGQTASSCTVTPTVTTSYNVTGSNASATAPTKTVTVTVNAPASTAPVCTLKSYSPTFTPGDEVLLTADCTPVATSWVWTGGGCAGKNTATCSDYPKVATTYTVIASNSIGADSKREVTVTPSTTTPSSECSLTAEPTSVAVGGSYTLAGKCGDSMVVSAKWNGEGCTETGASCTVKSTKAGIFTYTVAFTLQAGVTANPVTKAPYTATTTVTVTAANASAKPVCTLTANPNPVDLGKPVTLTASCIPAGTYTYSWDTTTCVATSATCQVTPTANTTYTVKGKNAESVESDSASIPVTLTPAGGATSYQGLWWNPAESGWGISVTQHTDKIFAAIYTYDAAGQPTWYSMSTCPITTEKPGSCTGEIYKVTGGSSPWVKWVGPVKVAPEGTGTFIFSNDAEGTFDYTLNSVSGKKSIKKYTFAKGTTQFPVGYTNLWMTAGEEGWGVTLTQDQGMLFATWFTYDDNSTPVWYTTQCVLTGTATGSRCNDALSKTTGGALLTSPWSITRKDVEIGQVTFTFSDAAHGKMIFAPTTGSTVSKEITPFGF